MTHCTTVPVEATAQSAKGHWENDYVRRSDGGLVAEAEYLGMDEQSRMGLLTVGEHFDSLDPDARRDYLTTRDICVEKAVTEVGLKAVHVVIDGIDHGVFPYPPHIDATA